MSYVLANTASNLGRRNLGRMGWDNPPYPRYPLPRSVARLNGLGDQTPNGAITYRIDPQTGQYNFYRTDIKPRGVFMQNTFQHPAPPVVSALRRPIRGITSAEPYMALSGLGCGSCGGTCNTLDGPRFVRRRRRGMGDTTDTFIDSNTGCVMDTDGNLLTCPSGPGGAQRPTESPVTSTTPTDPALLAQLVASGNAQATTTNPAQLAQLIAAGVKAGQPNIVVQQPAPSLFSGSTNIGGVPVSNAVLILGAVGAAVLLGSSGGKRR